VKKNVIYALIFIFLFSAWTNVCAENFSYAQLLKSYSESDLQLEELSVSLSQAELNLHKELLDSDMSWSVSSGSSSLGVDDTGIDFSTSPTLNLKFPSASNTTVKVTSPMSVSSVFSTETTNFSLNGAGVSVSSDFISSKDETTELSIEKKERSVLEAERKIASREISVEKAFLNELKTIYNNKLSVYEAEQSMLSAQTSLDTLVAQGYDKTSLKYRKAEMSYKSAEHKYDQAVNSYKTQLSVFCVKAGISVTDDFSVDIPDVKLANISDYPKEKYTEIESADWSSYINTKDRDISSDFTLSSNEGVSFSAGSGGSGAGSSSRSGNNFSATISAGITAKKDDLSFSAGVDIPINSSTKKPSLSFSITWTPSNKEAATIDDMTITNDLMKEAFAKQNAESSYDNAVSQYNAKRDSLTWEYNMNVEELKMYEEYLDDIEKWYKQGLVNRSEYQQAKNSYEDSYYAVVVSKIDKLIYNLDLKSLFVNY